MLIKSIVITALIALTDLCYANPRVDQLKQQIKANTEATKALRAELKQLNQKTRIEKLEAKIQKDLAKLNELKK